MIQRRQTVYLFLTAALLVITYFVPLGTFIGEKDSLVLYIYKIESLVPGLGMPFEPYFILPLFALLSLIIAVSLIAIFVYKNRRVQLLLVRFMLLLLLSYIGIYFFYYLDVLEAKSGGLAYYEYGLAIPSTSIIIPTIIFILPVIAAALLFMASHGIIRDEKLIRSADRLR